MGAAAGTAGTAGAAAGAAAAGAAGGTPAASAAAAAAEPAEAEEGVRWWGGVGAGVEEREASFSGEADRLCSCGGGSGVRWQWSAHGAGRLVSQPGAGGALSPGKLEDAHESAHAGRQHSAGSATERSGACSRLRRSKGRRTLLLRAVGGGAASDDRMDWKSWDACGWEGGEWCTC